MSDPVDDRRGETPASQIVRHQDVLYLDDLSVDQTFVSRVVSVGQDDIFEFAGRFDPQAFHLDPAAADTDPVFRGLAASGWHTAALTMRLLVESVPLANGVIGLEVNVTWPRPVRPGDSLHLRSTITEIAPSRSKPDRGIVTVESLTLNADDEVCQRLVSKVLVMRRP